MKGIRVRRCLRSCFESGSLMAPKCRERMRVQDVRAYRSPLTRSPTGPEQPLPPRAPGTPKPRGPVSGLQGASPGPYSLLPSARLESPSHSCPHSLHHSNRRLSLLHSPRYLLQLQIHGGRHIGALYAPALDASRKGMGEGRFQV
ncbi:hypothetical protein NN561_017402 [Cricetulus griseus]